MNNKIRVRQFSAAATMAGLCWHSPAFAEASEAAISPAMEEVVVTARLKSSAEALISERMNDDVAMDFVDADFISRVGDSTVAAALRRVAGLSLVNDKFVYIRGLGERYSSTLLNGAVVPSPDLTRNVIPLDLFPTTIVESLAVQKAYSSDMPAAFGGGAVDIRTKGIPDQFTYGIDVGIGHDSENESSHLSYKGGSDDKWGSDDGTRALSSDIKAAMALYQGNVEVQSLLSAMRARGNPGATLADAQLMNRQLALALNRDLSIKEESSEPNYDVKAYVGNNFYVGNDWELGFLASSSYKRGWDDTQTTASNFQFPDERFEIESESTRKTDLHANVNLGVQFTDDHRDAVPVSAKYRRRDSHPGLFQ
ncbi:MAG: TonB-dependent receptor plug domain-containing protein [Pseudomonadales bacterium]